MEEMVGQWWHQAITRLARVEHPEAAVSLAQVRKPIGILFRSAGGGAATRLTQASQQLVGGQRGWLQRLSGSGQRAALAQWEPDVVALPEQLAVFETTALNRDLYLWLALVSAFFEDTQDWLGDNQRATKRALSAFPGFILRYDFLVQTHLAQRPKLATLRGPAQQAEALVQAHLNCQINPDTTVTIHPQDVAPVWLWLSAFGTPQGSKPSRDQPPATPPAKATPNAETQRRRTRRAEEQDKRQALVLPFHSGGLMTWSEHVKVNRGTDDEDDGNTLTAANDMDALTIAPDGQTLASRVRFDLDLPSASADDVPLGSGLPLPEWDYRKSALLPGHCMVQVMQARQAPAFVPSPALKLTARRIRRKLETLRDAPRPQHGQDSGDDIDLDAWVRFNADQQGAGGLHTDSPPIYTRRVLSERSLATLLMADLSLSTDAYATPTERVIDVIRDALYVFGEALSAVDDPFAVWGFSSVRRNHVRLQHLKAFGEPWNDSCRARVGAIRPGFYTRMGAAVRHATQQLAGRGEQRRLLMLLTDGKPNDLDVYEGRYGLEDTRQAIREAQALGLSTFCVTIDEQAHDYLPMLFGQQGYALVHRPQDLVKQLTQAWANLSRR
ncbi:nitric oxide reductase activation protein NorD [Rhodoferax fermentans]|uniref:VWA domain-containing protein n=1 Tax=Rhodoferax fermentans TaxID=28066 RepID=A0A1T1AN29_RHOFE|nr:VWA domain-containing protein [Rhodoferax fermentans]MBK1684022.1 VWA domain-containing protein [Rhodoferax fermentans]OOV05437.1 VWA domain-containing protein [Rhodoferax fermentans]